MPCCTDNRARSTNFGALLRAILWAAVVAVAPLTIGADDAGAAAATAGGLGTDIVWHSSIAGASLEADMSFSPMLLYFADAKCPWCRRLETEVLSMPDVVSLLRHFALVRLEIAQNHELADFHGVRGLPTIIILSADGQAYGRIDGFADRTKLAETLSSALGGTGAFAEERKKIRELLGHAAEGKLEDEAWIELLLGQGRDGCRDLTRQGLLGLDPFPRAKLVSLLEHPRLAVRLGALEILEELTGDSFGLDPWIAGSRTSDNAEALVQWKDWAAAEKSGEKTAFTALTTEQVHAYVVDLAATKPERRARARRMLKQGGTGIVAALEGFIAENPALSADHRRAITELRYAILLQRGAKLDAATLAHRLVHGNLDTRLQTLRELQRVGMDAVPVLRDGLADPDPMVRETAIDSLCAVGGRRVVALLQEHLKHEKDRDVVFTAIRCLGTARSKRSLDVLAGYAACKDEDLIIAALQSIAKLRTPLAAEHVKPCLASESWRVRVAALKAVGDLSLKSLADDVKKAVDDKDDFVRFTALGALAAVADKGAVSTLTKVFYRDDSLKGDVIGIFGAIGEAPPKDFAASLDVCKPPVLLSILEGLDKCGQRGLDLAIPLADHADDDVACAAIALLGQHGRERADCKAKFLEFLQSGSRERVQAALNVLAAPPSDDSGYGGRRVSVDSLLSELAGAEDSEGDASPSSTKAQDLFDAFLGDAPAKPGDKKQSAPAKRVTVQDLFSAFLDDPKGSGSPSGQAVGPSGRVTKKVLLAAVRAHLDQTGDPGLRWAASLACVGMGDAAAVPTLLEQLSAQDASQRTRAAGVLRGMQDGPEAVSLLRAFLRDPAEQVRGDALENCRRLGGSPGLFDVVCSELLRPEAPLTPEELTGYEVSEIIQKTPKKDAVRETLAKLLDSECSDINILGLILHKLCWKRGDSERILPLTTSENPLLRRAAAWLIGQCDRKAFAGIVETLAADPSEFVRAVVPVTYARSRHSTQWQHYFDTKRVVKTYIYHHSQRNWPKLQPHELDVLKKLTDDPVPRVRVEAFFALLQNRAAVDLNAFVTTVSALPDVRAASVRIGRYLETRYQSLGPTFAVLLPYLDNSSIDEDDVKKIRAHFGVVVSDETLPAIPVTARPDQPALATYLAEPEAPSPGSRALKIIVFSQAGCDECAQVARMLDHLRESFSGLTVEAHDVRLIEAMALNEALCERFGVAEKNRLVAPAVFSAAGALVRSQITVESLGALLTAASSTPDDGWCVFKDDELADSRETIDERFRALDLTVVFVAGLLDGINPCALATLIFLLSYLQVTRRSRRQILQVGVAFILAVFLTYLALGLGLYQVVTGLSAIQYAGVLMRWGMIALVFVLFVLSLRDGVLCLRGKIDEMALQLPTILKRRVHAAVRTGARQRHFVAAAFVSGAVVSVLELACTGQVYAPTIMFVIQQGTHAAGAFGCLVLYNLAFIVPVTAVFVLACCGLTSDMLAGFLKRRAALVKFATALLFAAILVFLLWGDAQTLLAGS